MKEQGSRRRRVWGGLLLMASLGLAQGAQDAVAELRDPRKYLKAAERLRHMPSEEVLPALLAAFREKRFDAPSWSRYKAYEILAAVGARDEAGAVVFREPGQVAQLFEGLRDDQTGIRLICAQASARVDAPRRAEAVQRLTAALGDARHTVVAAAAGSLGKLGMDAEPALGDLLRLLSDPDEAMAKRWQAEREDPDFVPELGDPEIRVRAAAAFARLQIGGLALDRGIYERLNERGQQAAALALGGFAPSVKWSFGGDVESQSFVVEFLAKAVGKEQLQGSEASELVRVLGAIARSGEVAAAVRSKARAAVEGRLKDPREEIRRLARELLRE